MHPILIQFGDTAVHTYGAMGALGFIALCVVALRTARAKGWEVDRIVDVIFWTSISAIVGARGLWILQNEDSLPGLLDLINLRAGGLVFYGAFLGLPVGWWLVRRSKLPFGDVVDLFGRALPLGHAISRLGCFAAGCCYGAPTDLPWGVVFTDPLAPGPHDVSLHPTQLYEAAGLFTLFFALTWYEPRKRFGGQILLLYVLGYAVLRFGLEFLRGDPDRMFVLGGLLSTSQAISLVTAAGVAVLWPWLARRAQSSGQPA